MRYIKANEANAFASYQEQRLQRGQWSRREYDNKAQWLNGYRTNGAAIWIEAGREPKGKEKRRATRAQLARLTAQRPTFAVTVKGKRQRLGTINQDAAALERLDNRQRPPSRRELDIVKRDGLESIKYLARN